MRSSSSSHRRAFTLVELLVSMSLATLVMGGLASAMLIVSRAMPVQGETLSMSIDGYKTLERVTTELATAITFTLRGANAVEFTVADRDADLADETIRYEWSGVLGDPVTRTLNSGIAVRVAENVYDCHFVYYTALLAGGQTSLKTIEVGIQVGPRADAHAHTRVYLLNEPIVP